MNRKILVALIAIISLFLTACGGPTVRLEEGIDTIEVFDNYQAKRCFYVKGDEELRMTVVENTVDTDTVGVYLVEYEYESGNKTYSCKRVVHVLDQTAPTVTLNPGIDTIEVGSQWTDTGVTVTDNYYTEDFEIVTERGDLNTSEVGTYQVKYIVTDPSGNVTEKIRVVTVIEGDQ